MPYETVLASTLVFGVVVGASMAAASVLTMQSMGLWIELPPYRR
ncbi:MULTISPECIES: hypothetical protein [Paracoccus]|jgi:hypothetical protein|nr:MULTISPECIES: hypothetical protein [Paracoccus]MBB4630068.1 hypothetical protein [Paracoccus denitrificans]MCU7431401.1 hypothetical protein [Paracoccus denitrificans]MDK8875527.1 hypothetical protein [Paracoccus sp. SSJ]WQO33951.1 hypothetical protein U0005_02450 [Paracoccus denitrificans]SDJ86492.1 hypothetical protein SAMN04244581_04963 [Paracoccus denitrificans]